jgi:hypothetical protein
MRFPCLVLLVCTAALGQSAPRDASGPVPSTDLATQSAPTFRFDALSPNVCFGQKVSPIPAADGACSRRFQIDPKSLGSLYSLSRVYPPTEMTAQLDPQMVIHPPQSAIGVLPPAIPILPNIYPHLRMLYIHGEQSPAGPAQPQQAPSLQRP